MARSSSLSEAEAAELDSYVHVSNLLAVTRSKARQSLHANGRSYWTLRVLACGFPQTFRLTLKSMATTQAATNKSEQFNRFRKWIFFGGERVITENNRDEGPKPWQ